MLGLETPGTGAGPFLEHIMVEMHAISLVMALYDAAVVGFFIGLVVGHVMGAK